MGVGVGLGVGEGDGRRFYRHNLLNERHGVRYSGVVTVCRAVYIGSYPPPLPPPPAARSSPISRDFELRYVLWTFLRRGGGGMAGGGGREGCILYPTKTRLSIEQLALIQP